MTIGSSSSTSRTKRVGPYRPRQARCYNSQLKREVPNGWDAVRLERLSKITRGVSYAKEDY